VTDTIAIAAVEPPANDPDGTVVPVAKLRYVSRADR
jgi:hypothetical protein